MNHEILPHERDKRGRLALGLGGLLAPVSMGVGASGCGGVFN